MKAVDPKITRLLLAAAVLAVSACGGGGGNEDSPSPAPVPTPTPSPSPGRFSIGGSLDVVENLTVDSDTNDILQSPFVRNDTLATAQPISASAQVMGHANRAGTGPTIGRNFSGGDVSDFFQVTVAAGQTVELDFIADTNANDLDLYVYDNTGAEVGKSIGVGRSECVTFSAAGTYRIEVEAFAGASIYNLRTTAAGSSGACANATGANSLIAGELIVATPQASLQAARAATALGTAGLRVLRGATTPGASALVALPEDAVSRRKALAALGGTTRADAAQAADAATQRIKDTVAYAKLLRASGAFEYVLFNRTMKTAALTGTYPPNDTRYPLQRWHYEQIALPAAMNTLAAMNPQPTVRPIVAVVDTGLVADHPDFAGQTVQGYDFIRDAASAGDGNGIDNNPDDLRSGDSQPSFHGTHVAGTVAAATFDGAGAAGVAPMAQIMAIRVLGVGGSGSFYDIVQGIRYAARLSNDSGTLPAKRADVINLSLGAAGVACDSDTVNLFSTVRAQGSILVVATGNDANRPAATAPVGYPANCAGAIAVSSTDPRRGISYFSNTGSQVGIAAPGGDMRFSTTGTGLADGVYSTIATFSGSSRVPSFGPLQGTSMATPHVAGVMALMRWVNPALTPAQVDTLLAAGSLTDEAGAAGKDSDYGWGIVNASKAVQAAIASLGGGGTPPPAGIVEATPTTLDFGTAATALEFTLRTTGTTTERVTAVTSSLAAVTVAESSVDGTSKLGVYRVTVNRAALPLGVTTATITATTNAPRTITVSVTVEKRAVSTVADAGPIYVLAIDNATGTVLDQANLQPSNGRYTWSMTNVPGGELLIVAGSDYDNDNIICSAGEVCGAFPVFGANLTPITLDRNRNDLNFLLAPLGAGNAGAAAAGSTPAGQKRKPTPTLASNGSILKVPASAPKE
jgi:serine protease